MSEPTEDKAEKDDSVKTIELFRIPKKKDTMKMRCFVCCEVTSFDLLWFDEFVDRYMCKECGWAEAVDHAMYCVSCNRKRSCRLKFNDKNDAISQNCLKCGHVDKFE